MDRGREETLDVLRGLAILLVLLFHLRIDTGSPALDHAIAPLLDIGWAGVDIFFVLSGFLVGRIILREVDATGGFDRVRFFQRRIARLWPVLFLYLGATILTVGPDGWAMAWPVFLHIQNYSRAAPSHLWSLAVEEHFYFVAAWLLPLLAIRLGARVVGGALVAVILGAMTWRMIGWAGGVFPQDLQWQTQYRADALGIGVMIAWIDLHRPSWLRYATDRRGLCVLVAIVGIGTVAMIDDWRDRFGPGLIAVDCGAAALLLACRGAVIPPSLAAPARMMAALGGIAYPLYIWHPAIGQTGDMIAASWHITAPIAVTALRFTLPIAIASLIAMMVERPCMALSRPMLRFGRDRKPVVHQVS